MAGKWDAMAFLRNLAEVIEQRRVKYLWSLLLIAVLTLAFTPQPVKSDPRTWTVDDDGPADFNTIQEAIDNAIEGDTIVVSSGIYNESVVVNKRVALFGEDKNTTVIVGVVRTPVWGPVVSVEADNVEISNFTVTNGGHGIYLGARRSIVTDCIAHGNSFGLTISSSSRNLLRRNMLFNNSYNLEVSGSWWLDSFIHDIDTTNSANGKPIYYLVNKDNVSINPSSFSNVGYLGVVNSTNVQIANLFLSKNGNGLLIAFSPNTLVENVEATCNLEGISLMCSPGTIVRNSDFSYNDHGILSYYSDGAKIIENTISSNDGGIHLIYSNNSEIFRNSFIKNYHFGQASISASHNSSWDGGYPSGGNYWSDYLGVDVLRGSAQNETGSDGIGDSPYVLDEDNRDNYPLTAPYGSTMLSLNEDQIISRNVTVFVDIHTSMNVSRVDFYLDNMLVHTEPSTSVHEWFKRARWSWNTTSYADGKHDVSVIVYGTAGMKIASESVRVTVDNTKPLVHIIQPSLGAVLNRAETIEFSASDAHLEFVQLIFAKEGNTTIHLVSDATNFVWHTPFEEENYTITINAMDSTGHSASSSVTVLVDNKSPWVSISDPLESETIGLTYSILINTHDLGSGISQTKFYVDNVLLATFHEFPSYPSNCVHTYDWITTLYQEGEHTIRTVAFDGAGNNASHEITVIVDNPGEADEDYWGKIRAYVAIVALILGIPSVIFYLRRLKRKA